MNQVLCESGQIQNGKHGSNITQVLGDSILLQKVIDYLTVHKMKQLRFSITGITNTNMSHVKRTICAPNADAYFWHYQNVLQQLINECKVYLNV